MAYLLGNNRPVHELNVRKFEMQMEMFEKKQSTNTVNCFKDPRLREDDEKAGMTKMLYFTVLIFIAFLLSSPRTTYMPGFTPFAERAALMPPAAATPSILQTNLPFMPNTS